LPLDVLKIDRSLVQGIGQQSKSEAIICAIVGMTRALGCRNVPSIDPQSTNFCFWLRLGQGSSPSPCRPRWRTGDARGAGFGLAAAAYRAGALMDSSDLHCK
jgi:hypothetical protein